jgi:hypothetical protein
MAPVELLQALIAEGVEFSTDGRMIRWRNAEGWMKPDVIATLKSGKSGIIAYLMERGAGGRR